jgi:sulfate adenylyltransferase
MTPGLIEPHGGKLLDLFAGKKRSEELKSLSSQWPSWNLTPRQICHLELLLCGGFSPLAGFMTRADCQSVLTGMRLQDGTFWPAPITLDLPGEVSRGLDAGGSLVLRDLEGVAVAVLHVQEVFQPEGNHFWCAGGRVEGIQPIQHYDFTGLRSTPAETRKRLGDSGWRKVVAFRPAGVMHRAEQEFTLEAARKLEAGLLIHPAVGLPEAGDADHYTRVRCLQATLKYYPGSMATLRLLPLAETGVDAREALLLAIVHKNYGSSHLVTTGEHRSLEEHRDDTGVEPVLLENKERSIPSGIDPLKDHLGRNQKIPSRLSFPEVIRELKRTYPPRSKQGFTVFFTGLPSAGKSTVANVLLVKLMEMGFLPVTLLDGDIVRRHLSSELGFSREHRDINIRRIGFVASEITKNGGVAICAPIAPFESVRREVREMIAPRGGFILVHVATPLSVCESRDRKGLYAKARKGVIKEYTGISDPYETPEDADLLLDTSSLTPEECARKVVVHLQEQGYIKH